MKNKKLVEILLPTLLPAAAYSFVVIYFSDSVDAKLLLLSGTLGYLSAFCIYDSVCLLSIKHFRGAFKSLAAAPFFLIAACLLFEWQLFDIRNDHFYLLLPELAMDTAPIIIMIAYIGLLHRKIAGKHFKLIAYLYAASSIFFFLCSLDYSFSFSYIFLDIVNCELYSFLSMAFMLLMAVIGLEIMLSPKKVSMINSLIVASLVIRIAINFEEYTSGMVLRAIYIKPVVSVGFYIRSMLYSVFASYPTAILFALLFIGPVLSKASFGNGDESAGFIHIRQTEDGFEIPPNTPSL